MEPISESWNPSLDISSSTSSGKRFVPKRPVEDRSIVKLISLVSPLPIFEPFVTQLASPVSCPITVISCLLSSLSTKDNSKIILN